MVAALFLVGSLIGAWFTWNAWRPVRPGRVGPLWLPALVTAELVPFHLAWQALLTAGFVALGALDARVGQVAMAVTVFSWTGLIAVHVRALRSGRAMLRATGADRLARLRGWPVPRLPEGVELTTEVRYGPHPRHVVDVYRRRDLAEPAPVIVQVHGGSWVRGRRDRQARPLMYHLANEGWVVVAISYRVSPEATFPDHLVDVKRAIGWLRTNAGELGADGRCLAITGGSAGGHLAALAALTDGEPGYQPGFEGADTSVQAGIAFYGVHSLLRSDGRTPLWPWLTRVVMKVVPHADPEAWLAASPQHIAHGGAPPLLLLHGTHDSAVREHVSARFSAALAAVGAPVTYVPVLGATHGFDYFTSVRGRAAAAAAAAFLNSVSASVTADADE